MSVLAYQLKQKNKINKYGEHIYKLQSGRLPSMTTDLALTTSLVIENEQSHKFYDYVLHLFLLDQKD